MDAAHMGADLERILITQEEIHARLDELGSLGSAARVLGISQPAASARLRSLESRYGLNLVTRSTRGSRQP